MSQLKLIISNKNGLHCHVLGFRNFGIPAINSHDVVDTPNKENVE